jgi:hypothetical protein
MNSGRFAIATNVSIFDAAMIKHTIPHWLRVFGDRLSKILIVLDRTPPIGRIAELHSSKGRIDEVESILERHSTNDKRIQIVEAASKGSQLEQAYSRAWFAWGTPIRCQIGTPILVFIQAVLECSGDFVMRCDCDMLFNESGWLNKSIDLLAKDEFDLVEPPRLGLFRITNEKVSSRAFILRPQVYKQKFLPMKPYMLDPLRIIHRLIHRRPVWLALEQMLQREVDVGRLRHKILRDSGLGFSMHVARREDALTCGFANVVESVEEAPVPQMQRELGWNFVPDAWRVP